MTTSRLEAFSDGVIAVIITVMVLELKAPLGSSLHDLRPLLPNFLIYALSFQVVGTYWNNHHHLLRATKVIDANVMWFNLLLLFFISLIPFFTSWFGEHPTAKGPTAAYGTILFAGGVGYFLLLRAIVAADKMNTKLRKAVGNDRKGKISILSYLAAILLTFVSPWIAITIYVLVALTWFIPDKRLEPISPEG